MADASDAFAAAAVSALCWVPQGSAAPQPRSYLLEAQDRQALRSRLQKQQRRRRLQGRRRGAGGRLRVQQQQKKEVRRGRRGRGERAAEDKEEEHAAAGASEMQVDDEEEEEDKKDEDEEKAAASEAESMDATDGEEEEDDESQHLFGVVREDGPATLNDPYLKLDEGEDSEEEEANRVLPTDLLLVAANAEQDCSSLEVYVYDDESGGFYVHHDILTGGYPLCLEWINTCPAAAGANDTEGGTKRNLVASGSFDPEISLWDLDVLDRIDAVCTLGGEPTLTAGRPAARRLSKNKKKKQRSAAAAASSSAQHGHKGPVMTLHKAPMKGHVLASGSADESVKLWDLHTAACVHTYRHHTNKVQAVRWHPTEEAALLTTGYDRRAAVLDVRSPQNIVYASSLSADAEACVWDRHHSFNFWVSTEDGCVACYDARRLKSSGRCGRGGPQRPGADLNSLLWRIQAHKQAASGVTDSEIPDLMVTCGVDGDGKLWKVNPEAEFSSAPSGGSSSSGSMCESDAVEGVRRQPQHPSAGGSCAPVLIFERALKAGPLYCCCSNEDIPQVLGFGGSCVAVWDVTDTEHVKRVFRLK